MAITVQIWMAVDTQHYKDKDFSHLKEFVCTDLPSHPPDPVIEVVADDAELPYLTFIQTSPFSSVRISSGYIP